MKGNFELIKSFYLVFFFFCYLYPLFTISYGVICIFTVNKYVLLQSAGFVFARQTLLKCLHYQRVSLKFRKLLVGVWCCFEYWESWLTGQSLKLPFRILEHLSMFSLKLQNGFLNCMHFK